MPTIILNVNVINNQKTETGRIDKKIRPSIFCLQV